MSFFFILSGFVLAWALPAYDGARNFYRRRFARIYPGFALSLVAFGLVVLRPLHRFDLGSEAASALLVQSWIPKTGYVFGGSAVSWSLSCEAFFYALFPVAVVGLRRIRPERRRAALVFLGLASVAVMLAVIAKTPLWPRFWVGFFPPSRLPEFLIGILLAWEVKEGRWPRLSLPAAAAIALLAVLITGQLGDWRYSVCIPLVPFVLLIGAAATADIEHRRSILRHGFMIRLGQWSYAIYLFHTTLIFWVAAHYRPVRTVKTGLVWAGCTVGAVAIAALVYYAWERPFERLLRPGRTDRSEERLAAKDAVSP